MQKRFRYIMTLGAFLGWSMAQAQENRERTSGEDRFYKATDKLIRQAVAKVTVPGWERARETPDESHFQPQVSMPRNKGPYSYSYELLFNWANVNDVTEATDSLTAVIMKNPSDPDGSLKIEALSARYVCRIKVEVNLLYTAQEYGGGRIVNAKLPGVTHITAVPIGKVGPGSGTPATTVYLLGNFPVPKLYRHGNGRSGNIVSEARPAGQAPFLLHTLVVTIYATAPIADQFARLIDFPSLAAQLNKQLQ
jgi:hypothetical protein